MSSTIKRRRAKDRNPVTQDGLHDSILSSSMKSGIPLSTEQPPIVDLKQGEDRKEETLATNSQSQEKMLQLPNLMPVARKNETGSVMGNQQENESYPRIEETDPRTSLVIEDQSNQSTTSFDPALPNLPMITEIAPKPPLGSDHHTFLPNLLSQPVLRHTTNPSQFDLPNSQNSSTISGLPGLTIAKSNLNSHLPPTEQFPLNQQSLPNLLNPSQDVPSLEHPSNEIEPNRDNSEMLRKLDEQQEEITKTREELDEMADKCNGLEHISRELVEYIKDIHSTIIRSEDCRINTQQVRNLANIIRQANLNYKEIEEQDYVNALCKQCAHCNNNKAEIKLHGSCQYCKDCLIDRKLEQCRCEKPIEANDLLKNEQSKKYLDDFICECRKQFLKDKAFKCQECSTSQCWNCYLFDIKKYSKESLTCSFCTNQHLIKCEVCNDEKELAELYLANCSEQHLTCKKCSVFGLALNKCILDEKPFFNENPSFSSPSELRVDCCVCGKESAEKYISEKSCPDGCPVCLKCQTISNLLKLEKKKDLACIFCDAQLR